MKRFSGLELFIYGGGSILYWGFVYIVIKLAPILVCGMGPDAVTGCPDYRVAYAIGVAALALYGFVAWLTLRDTE